MLLRAGADLRLRSVRDDVGVPSALPQDLGSFERHRSICMIRNDARSVVTRRASCGYLGRIDKPTRGSRAGLARSHGFEIRSVLP